MLSFSNLDLTMQQLESKVRHRLTKIRGKPGRLRLALPQHGLFFVAPNLRGRYVASFSFRLVIQNNVSSRLLLLPPNKSTRS
jgi:hypothetical protein